MEEVGVCCHRNREPIMRSKQLGVGSDHLSHWKNNTFDSSYPVALCVFGCGRLWAGMWTVTFSDFVLGIWLSVELCFDIFPFWHAAPPPAPHTDQGSVNYKRIWWEVCLRKRIRRWLMCPEKEANQWKINGFVTNVVQPNCVCDCLRFKRKKMAHL